MLGFAALGELALGEVPLLTSLPGAVATGAVGVVGVAAAETPPGVAASGGVGSLVAEPEVTIGGVAAGGAAGALTAVIFAAALAGVVASGIAGDISISEFPIGVAGTGVANGLGWPEADTALSGVVGTGAIGVAFSTAVPAITGVAGTGIANGLGWPEVDQHLSGVAGSGVAGSVIANPEASLLGVSALVSPGTVLFPGQVLTASVFATGAAGTFSLALFTGSIPAAIGTGVVGSAIGAVMPAVLGGVLAAGFPGTIGYFGIAPNLVGVYATGAVNDLEIVINTPAGMAGWSDFIARDGDAYAQALADLLPTGSAWPRDPDRVVMKVVAGLAQIWGSPVDSAAATLLTVETDPRATTMMLPDWETAFGLPDSCVAEPLTVADRQQALVAKMTLRGGQSRQFFYQLARKLGYDIEILEYRPYLCGVSQCGDTTADGLQTGEPPIWQCGPPSIRFYWTVRVYGLRVTWFRCGGGGGECGVDPMCRISLATDLECEFKRYKPAQTSVVFDYSHAVPDSPISVTSSSVTLPGVFGSGAIGPLTTIYGAQLSGVAGIGVAATFVFGGNVAGASGTGAVGALSAAVSPAALAGVAATGIVGSAGRSDITALTGVAATAAAGTIAAQVAPAPAGVAGAGAAGLISFGASYELSLFDLSDLRNLLKL